MENNELQHWGIKGMKWGVRRYQNSDGTLTTAGKKRYNQEMSKLRAEKQVLENKRKTQAKIDKLDAMRKEIDDMKSGKKSAANSSDKEASGKKSAKDMSDKELAAATARLQAEKAYKDAYAALNPEHVSRGKQFIDRVKDNVVDKGPDLLTNFIGDYVDKVAREKVGLKKNDEKSTSEKLKQALEDAKNQRDLDDLNDKRYQKLKRAAAEAELFEKINKNINNTKSKTEAKTDKNSKTEPKSDGNSKTEAAGKSTDDKKVYKGTVVGEGTSKGSSKKSDNGPIIDVDWEDVTVSNVPAVYTNTGRNYIDDYLNKRK